MPLGRHLEEHFLRQVRALSSRDTVAAVARGHRPDRRSGAARTRGRTSGSSPWTPRSPPKQPVSSLLLPRVASATPSSARPSTAAPRPPTADARDATLAAVTDETIDPVRRAWHLANAATAPDEAVATLARTHRPAGPGTRRSTGRGGIPQVRRRPHPRPESCRRTAGRRRRGRPRGRLGSRRHMRSSISPSPTSAIPTCGPRQIGYEASRGC